MNPITFDQYLQELKPAVKTEVFAQEQNSLERVAAAIGGSLESCCLFPGEMQLGQYPDLLRDLCQPVAVGGEYMLYAKGHFGLLCYEGSAVAAPLDTLVWNSEQYSEEDLLVGPYE